jgi:outer membrane murein-binding lipoprotein Lpp
MNKYSIILILAIIGTLFALGILVSWWVALSVFLAIFGTLGYIERIFNIKWSRKWSILFLSLFILFSAGNIIKSKISEDVATNAKDQIADLTKEKNELRKEVKQAKDDATIAKGQVEKERLARIQLEKESRRVRSFEIDFDIQFTSNWSGTPPRSPRVMVLGQSTIAKIDIALKAGNVRPLDLYMDKEPSFGPRENGWVHTTFRVKAQPGSWIMGSDARELAEVRKLIFRPYGVNPQDSRDGNFTIGVKSRVFVNGRQVALIESKPEKEDLSQLLLQDKGFDMFFVGHWIIQLE